MVPIVNFDTFLGCRLKSIIALKEWKGWISKVSLFFLLDNLQVRPQCWPRCFFFFNICYKKNYYYKINLWWKGSITFYSLVMKGRKNTFQWPMVHDVFLHSNSLTVEQTVRSKNSFFGIRVGTPFKKHKRKTIRNINKNKQKLSQNKTLFNVFRYLFLN